jgi:hypothetical protein
MKSATDALPVFQRTPRLPSGGSAPKTEKPSLSRGRSKTRNSADTDRKQTAPFSCNQTKAETMSEFRDITLGDRVILFDCDEVCFAMRSFCDCF